MPVRSATTSPPAGSRFPSGRASTTRATRWEEVPRAKGRLKGRAPKLSSRQQRELGRMHATGDYTVAELAELFNVSRPTVYRVLERVAGAASA
jgi:DNA invertase Pin-like site-specific DNA recombinase